jgi:hypothetical protein
LAVLQLEIDGSCQGRGFSPAIFVDASTKEVYDLRYEQLMNDKRINH